MEQEKQIQYLITVSVLWAKKMNLLDWQLYRGKTHIPTASFFLFFFKVKSPQGRGKHFTVLMKDFGSKSQCMLLVKVGVLMR